MKRSHIMPFGATVAEDHVHFRLWAPAATTVEVYLEDGGVAQSFAMKAMEDGWYELQTTAARANSLYRYRINGSTLVPDPASRFNPHGVHGPSAVINPRVFEWSDVAWQGCTWDSAVFYEIHVGAFTSGGNFDSAVARLDYLASLGVTVVELMPIAAFPGDRNWGYDGVLPYAPHAGYGGPDALKRLIQAAHARGLRIMLDVVYNHFGPEGNYLRAYAPQFFTDRHHTPWGAAINFDGAQSEWVRQFFIHNALYWLDEYRFDGLRLDAVHAIIDNSFPDVLTELASAVYAGPGKERSIHLVLENDRNEAFRLTRKEGQRRYFDAQWNDDAHHALHVALTRERAGYYADYAADPINAIGRALTEGFFYQGQYSKFRDGLRGESSRGVPLAAFINFLQNHDQIGNRAKGERLAQLAPRDALRVATAILLLAPSPPLLFMGEEYAASTPFLFFCDFSPEIAAQVRDGRRKEFMHFPEFRNDTTAIPDPGAKSTFEYSCLNWKSTEDPQHLEMLGFYRNLLTVRAREIVPRLSQLVVGGARFERIENTSTLVAYWPLIDGSALKLIANFGSKAVHDCKETEGRTLYCTPNASAAWSAHWLFLEEKKYVPL